MRILVDADACPRRVLEIIRRLQEEYSYELITVSSFRHVHDGLHHVTVGDEDQAADIALINRVRKGDIVVTNDWGLAALVLGKGARAVDPGGRVYSAEKIDFFLEERHMKAKFRRGGGRTKGPPARIKADDLRFEENFRQLLT